MVVVEQKLEETEFGLKNFFVMLVCLALGALGMMRMIFVKKEKPKQVKAQGVQTEAAGDAGAQGRAGAQHSRSVTTQSQCTYKRHLEQPRFYPLPEHSHGVWEW